MALAQPASPAQRSPLGFEDPGLAGLRELTNLNDIMRLLHEVAAKERSVNAELEGLLSKRGALEGGLVTLQSSTAEVDRQLTMRSACQGLRWVCGTNLLLRQRDSSWQFYCVELDQTN